MIFDFANQTAFLFGAILVAGSCLIYTLAQRHTDRPQNTLFILNAALLVATAACELIYVYVEKLMPLTSNARMIISVCNFGYYLTHALLPVILLYYSLMATRNYQRISIPIHALYLIPTIFSELIILTNP